MATLITVEQHLLWVPEAKETEGHEDSATTTPRMAHGDRQVDLRNRLYGEDECAKENAHENGVGGAETAKRESTVVIVPGESVQALERLPRMHTSFDEAFLQKLLTDHPELLPIHDVRDDVGSLVCVGREVVVASGKIDNLYLSTGATQSL